MTGKLKAKPTTRRDAADTVRLKAAGEPAHINAREAALLQTLMPEAAGPVITKGLLAKAGIRGDDRVTKLIPAEAAILKARGGAGTRNPATGLLQFYGDGSADDSSHGTGNGGLGDAATGSNNGRGEGGNNTYSGDWGGGMSLGYAQPYDPTTMPSIESILNTPNGYRAPGYEGLSMVQYSPPDTLGRLVDTFRYGPPPSYRDLGQVPGRYGGPSGRGPGVMGTMAGMLAGGPISAALGLGMHFDQAMSPETRAASMKENQAIGAKNSTGQDHGLSMAQLESQAPGTQFAGTTSGAATAQQPPPGYTVNPAGQIVPLPQGNNRPAYQDPIRNLIADYILRGRSGGFGW